MDYLNILKEFEHGRWRFLSPNFHQEEFDKEKKKIN
jgi:hypothetical protein